MKKIFRKILQVLQIKQKDETNDQKERKIIVENLDNVCFNRKNTIKFLAKFEIKLANLSFNCHF